MTALLEFKQKMKILYGRYETFILPALKFILAFVTFKGINSILGFVGKLNNIFIVLILAILCGVLPINAIAIVGIALIVGHCYALGMEVAGFALVLMILLVILLLRFSGKENLALILTPISFVLRIPAAIPIGSGLLRTPTVAIPAGCGVILYYFMTLVKDKATMLKDVEADKMQKIKLLLDGLIKNQTMWLTILAFVAVVIVVYVIRKLSIDYSWHVAIFVGGVIYIAVMVAGGLFMDVTIKMSTVLISTIGSVIVGFLLEFFAMGVDYTRTETLQYEDDEYVYYVKAVPKAYITESKRSIKTIKQEPLSEKKLRDQIDDRYLEKEILHQLQEDAPLEKVSVDEVNFEEKLEESLRDL